MGASTTTSTMLGVSRITSCTIARSSPFSLSQQIGGFGPVGARRASSRDTTG